MARRLLAEPVALLFATRRRTEELAGLPELAVEGLRDADARTLLVGATLTRLDVRVSDCIVAETRGNPLALLELPRGFTPAELAVGFGVPVTASLSGTIEESFARAPASSRSKPSGFCWRRPPTSSVMPTRCGAPQRCSA